ncbi:MAG: InlB B-repeat-containing protein [Clostridia bacterium]|nr:InlB B-repeat-containing protein [Clostridia bacterium]
MPLKLQTAYAATTVGQDATQTYNTGGVQGYTRSIASQTASSGTNTTNGITYSWNGAAGDSNNIMINAGATYTVTATNIPNVDRLLYARLMIYQPTKYPDLDVTMSITFGTKSVSYNLNTSTRDSYNFYPDLKGGNGNSVTWTVKNNSGSAAYISQGYCDLSVARNYTVNFDKKGGSGGSDSTSVWHYFSYSKITAPTKTGYKFLGYFDAETGGTKYYNADGTATKSAWDKASTSVDNWTVKLYAQWELMEFDVTLNDNGGTGGQGTVKATSTMSMPNLTQLPTRTGYSFQGYYDAKSGGKQYFDKDGKGVGTYDLTKATTVYARWEALKYTATFDSTNGTGGLTSFEFTYDSTLPDLTSEQFPTRESSGGHSYSFGGYYTQAPTENADGSQTPNGKQYYNDLGKGVGLWKEANNTTVLYAYWTIDMSVTSSGYEGTWDGEAHGITIDVVSPEDTTIYYGNTASTCNNTNANNFLKSNAGNYTIYFEVKKDGYTTYRHNETIVINKAESIVSTVPTAKTGLEFTNENQELITAGTVDYGNMLYAVNTTGELPEASEFSAEISTGKLVGTYYVFYKSSGDDNHNEYAASINNKVEVLIAEVDKTALANKIDEVVTYFDTIDVDYSAIAQTLESVKNQVKIDGIDNPNVTSEYVAGKVTELQNALSDAKVNVTETKIDVAVENMAYTTQSKALIDEAKDYFDNTLTSDEQNAVDSAKVASLEKALADYNAVNSVVNQINAIGASEDTPEFRQKVSSARDAYNALTSDQKQIFPVDVLKILTDDENAIIVMDKINAIGDVEYNSTSKGKIDVANNAYSALSADQKALVANYTTLTQANTDYDKVDEATGKVNNIGDVEYTPESEALLDEAREYYNNLTPYQKSIFHDDTLNTLVDDEKAYESMDKVYAIGTIENSQDSKDKIVEARETYDALTTDQKALVDSTFVTDLENAETVFAVIEKVNDIGKIEYNDDSKALIEKAREEYENLTDEQKLLFPESAVEDIQKAETTYKKIEKNANIISIVFLVFSILLLIAGIVVMILLLKKRKELKKEKSTKLLSVVGLPMLLAATSHYFDAPFIALYVLAFLTVCVWVADLIIYLNNKKLKKAIKQAEAEDEMQYLGDNNLTENHELAGLNDKIRPVYIELKKEILSYNGTKAIMGKRFEYIKLGRETILKFAVKDKTLCVYYDVDVDSLNSKYMVEQERSRNSVGVTCVYKIKNYRRLNYAKQIITLLAKKFDLKK